VHVALLQQLTADGLAGAAFEQHVIRNYHRRASANIQAGLYMLKEVQLLVAGGRPLAQHFSGGGSVL
jgi:hypothetical protein